MDIVYKVKPSETNEELRHSLRSVAANVTDARVVLVGYKPSWVTGVDHIPVAQARGQKHPNSLRVQKAALQSLTISDPFWLFDDDMFVLASLTNSTQMPVYHWGAMADVLLGYGPERLGTMYYKSMAATRDVLCGMGYTNPLCYGAHVPLYTHKEPMLWALNNHNQEGVWIQHASIYGNVAGLGGQALTDDVKLYATRGRLPDWVASSDYASTSDISFLRGPIGRWLRERFSEPCRFELP